MLVAQASGGATTRSAQDLAAPLSQVLQVGATDYIYGAGRIAALGGTSYTWYATDALGSVRGTLDAASDIHSLVSYDPWGKVESGTVPTFGFTGELQQGSQVYLRARWYNAARGGFGSVDPFVGDFTLPMSFASYLYAYNQPMGYTDPSGLCVGCPPTPAPGPVPTAPTATPRPANNGATKPMPTPAQTPVPDTEACPIGVPCKTGTADPIDIGFIVGVSASGALGTAGVGGGFEVVYDLYDFEVAAFYYGNFNGTWGLGANLTSYVGVITGWSNYRNQIGVSNYKGASFSLGLGGGLFSGQVFSSGPKGIGGCSLGAGLSFGQKYKDVDLSKIFPEQTGSLGLSVYENFHTLINQIPEKTSYHRNGFRQQTTEDAFNFISETSSTLGFIDPALVGVMSPFILFNGDSWERKNKKVNN